MLKTAFKTIVKGIAMIRPDFGWIEVIGSGAMYAGKTREFIKRIDELKWAKKKKLIVKPMLDDRYGESCVVSHNGDNVTAINIKCPLEILDLIKRDSYDVVAIDEAQFFDKEIVQVIKDLRDKGLLVLITGLNTTAEGKPFGPMPEILCIADNITILYGVCAVCGKPATKTFALFDKDQDIVVGGQGKYEPRCNKHWACNRD